ncbi:hypothetical protein M0R45_022295 [Rubus argutus]|uniref:Secreted protein n=1 Tax=Rubus argutus TaxID=59490 RepID=A0AAW1XE23_RUBAR
MLKLVVVAAGMAIVDMIVPSDAACAIGCEFFFGYRWFTASATIKYQHLYEGLVAKCYRKDKSGDRQMRDSRSTPAKEKDRRRRIRVCAANEKRDAESRTQ